MKNNYKKDVHRLRRIKIWKISISSFSLNFLKKSKLLHESNFSWKFNNFKVPFIWARFEYYMNSKKILNLHAKKCFVFNFYINFSYIGEQEILKVCN